MKEVIASLPSILVEFAKPPANHRSFDYFSTLEFMQCRFGEIAAANKIWATQRFTL
jgi:hypothetical protein